MTTISDLLKEVYEDGPNEQINQEVTALRRIERSSEGITNEVGGRYVAFPVHISRNSGVGARAEMAALPTPGNQGHKGARVPLKYQYGGIQLTGQTIKLADSNYQAFASVLENEMSGLTKDLAKNLNFQIYGDGKGGRATVSAVATAAATVTFSPQTFKYINLGGRYSIVTAASYAAGSAFTAVTGGTEVVVTNLNKSTGVVTFAGADGVTPAVITAAVGDKLVLFGSYLQEWNGFSNIISDTGILHNIDPATVPVWKGVVSNGTAPGTPEALTESRMINVVDEIRQNGGKASVGFCDLGVRRAYFNLLKAERRFVNTQEFEGGFSGLAFTTDQGDIPIVVDVDAPANKMFFIDESEMTLFRENDFAWMDQDGSKFQRVVTSGGVAGNYDAYYATMFQYSELGTHRRNSAGVLNDITAG
jgi:hypothetical protein